ncbi:MAG: anti-sigma regulatory factor [candidate division Zixibacteria bacterium SM23_81]|nr:MAG: anti-sigma regulatory factor [candidate division Zixibacteria bacterium SM23_81]
MASETSFQQEFAIEGGDFNNAGRASSRLRNILKQIGISPLVIRRVSTASYEAEMNVVLYARRGTLSFMVTPEKITIVVEDEGQGIADIGLAMQEGYSTASREIREMGFGAGMGLPNIKKNADELEISSEVGLGTTVRFSVKI